MRVLRSLLSALNLMVLACALQPVAHAGPLNDSGIDFYRSHLNGSNTRIDAAGPDKPDQDARYGRDAAALAGVLPKAGASAGTPRGNPNGFDFTKVSASGEMLPAHAELGPGPSDWACTYDHNTGLTWEVKMQDSAHLRHQGHTYTWFFGGNNHMGPGIASGGRCHRGGRCDTEKFTQDVNAAGLCGYHDWRIPTASELSNLADRGRSEPAIDPDYFPNTPAAHFWSATPLAADLPGAWATRFQEGANVWRDRSEAFGVRLVR